MQRVFGSTSNSFHSGAQIRHNYRLIVRSFTKLTLHIHSLVEGRNFKNLGRLRIQKFYRYSAAPIGVSKNAELFAGNDGAHPVLPHGNQRQPHRGRRFLRFVTENRNHAIAAARQACIAVPCGGRGLQPTAQREKAFTDPRAPSQLFEPADFFVVPLRGRRRSVCSGRQAARAPIRWRWQSSPRSVGRSACRLPISIASTGMEAARW